MIKTTPKHLVLTRCETCNSQFLYWTDKGKKAPTMRPLYCSTCRRITNHRDAAADVAEVRFEGQ